eukprot:TRINITY_DN7125_c0_g1_i2.p1 TRINITY_DN7125_c0_g1~~TRINITY_DN7125_c0_g1_i2.p1  ORF type:complete len:263 (+),score=44.63 TRINITY_DN7125_c0_g1_i2:153-941(+)
MFDLFKKKGKKRASSAAKAEPRPPDAAGAAEDFDAGTGLSLFAKVDGGDLFPVEVSPDATVETVLREIGRLRGFPLHALTMQDPGGQAMPVRDTLADLGICPQSTVEVSSRRCHPGQITFIPRELYPSKCGREGDKKPKDITVAQEPGKHTWYTMSCRMCTRCGLCTGFSDGCCHHSKGTNPYGTDPRVAPLDCGCGSGEGGCAVCGLCKACGRKFACPGYLPGDTSARDVFEYVQRLREGTIPMPTPREEGKRGIPNIRWS